MIGQTVSHYKILERLGGGGMGVVYKAEDTRLKRTVALKFLSPELTRDPGAKERFVHEAQAASALQHNNICVVHDIDETKDGQMFIVMELYEGETLKKRIERGSLTFEEVADIAGQIADGLCEAHRHSLLHRDIKPANIILTHQGVVKIVDFGLAKLAGQTKITRPRMTSGTAAYMSPEQTRGEEVDRRTDIWSFGVVLHEMLTGQSPFRGEHPLALMYAIVNEEPEDLSHLRPDVPDQLKALCARCLEKDKEKRLSDLSEVQGLLGRHPRTSIRLWRFFPGRTRVLRWASLGAAVCVVAILVLVLAPAKSIQLESTDYLVVADVENRTKEPVFDRSLTEALRISIRQSTQINILPAERVATALKLLQIPDSRPLDEETAIGVARREGARAVVAANISRLGSTYVLSCGIIDGNTGETVRILREEIPKIEGVLSGMDRLCENVRRSLGESMSQISKAREPLEQVTTSSLEALELYSRGGLFTSEGKYREAATLIQQAVSIDSQFVMAISELAYCYRKIGNDSLATVYHKQILPLIHRVTDRERLEILAVYYGPSFEMDFQKADEYTRQLTVMYPNDAYAFATLGHLAMFAGDTKTALEANATAVTLYREYDRTCYNNSGFALALNGEPTEALVWFRKAKALRPSYPAIDMYMALTHWMNEDLDSSETLLIRAFPEANGPQRNQIRVILSSLHHFRGELSKARDLCIDGIKECRALNKPGDEAYFHFLLGEISAVEGKMDEYRARMKNAAALSISPYFELVLVGRSLCRSGMIADAERVITRISTARSFDPFFLRRRSNVLDLMRGEVLLAEGAYGRAREYFQAVSRIQAGDPFYFLARQGIAECAIRISDSSAPALCDSLLAHRGEMMMGSLSSIRQTGFWTRWLWPDIHLELGKFYASAHNKTVAEHHLNAAMYCWKNAEPGDRRAATARTLLLRLSKIR